MIATFILPYMHDRYMYVADVLSIIYCFIKGKRKIYVPICINLCSLYTYHVFLSRTTLIDIKYIALINAFIVVSLTASFFINIRRNANNYIGKD